MTLKAEERVHKAAKELLEKGIEPSVRKVRDHLGGGGTEAISRYLKSWRERHTLVDYSAEDNDPVMVAISYAYDAVQNRVNESIQSLKSDIENELTPTLILLEDAKEMVATLSEDLADSQSSSERLGVDLRAASERASHYQAENSSLAAENSLLKEEVKSYKERAADLAIIIGRLQAELESAKQNNTALMGQIEDLQQANKAAHVNELQGLRESIEKLAGQRPK